MTFITLYCYNSIVLVVIVNLLLCPTYKLNFIMGMNRGKVFIELGTISLLAIHWGSRRAPHTPHVKDRCRLSPSSELRPHHRPPLRDH